MLPLPILVESVVVADSQGRVPQLFGQFPNIWGRLSYLCANDARATGYENGALYYAYPAQEVKMLSDYNIENKIPADPAIDASKCNSLYQEGLTEIRVNALYGLNLIRAF